jgi:hypothetical protein
LRWWTGILHIHLVVFFAGNHSHAFDDLNANIRRQIEKVEAHP